VLFLGVFFLSFLSSTWYHLGHKCTGRAVHNNSSGNVYGAFVLLPDFFVVLISGLALFATPDELCIVYGVFMNGTSR